MEPILSYCGMRCDLCLAFKPNLTKHPENRQILSDGWHEYFGFRIPPEKIYCNGCRDNANLTLDEDCPVRPCVIDKKLDNCAQCQDMLYEDMICKDMLCEDMICETLKERLVDFEELQRDYGRPIPPADRFRFIFPYENAHRLEELRKSEQ